jgi:hypothetical protein
MRPGQTLLIGPVGTTAPFDVAAFGTSVIVTTRQV